MSCFCFSSTSFHVRTMGFPRSSVGRPSGPGIGHITASLVGHTAGVPSRLMMKALGLDWRRNDLPAPASPTTRPSMRPIGTRPVTTAEPRVGYFEAIVFPVARACVMMSPYGSRKVGARIPPGRTILSPATKVAGTSGMGVGSSNCATTDSSADSWVTGCTSRAAGL